MDSFKLSRNTLLSNGISEGKEEESLALKMQKENSKLSGRGMAWQ